ncbi:PAS domain S-box protein [Methylocystis sp. JAN1]|uniref:PAS domain S-box protein n=1 Tax=Methylocystis sp. JAN1 TaxID=3397211 RepID=UPI003FA24DB2
MTTQTALSSRLALVVTRRNPVVAYGIAIAALVAATFIRWLAQGWLVPGIPFVTFFPAVLVATVFGGMRVGLFTTLSSVVIAWFLFMESTQTWGLDLKAIVSLSSFLFVAVMIVLVLSLFEDAVRRIAAQEQSQRALIESAPNGIVIVARSGAILGLNSSAEKLFGYAREELLGKPVETLVPENVAAAHAELRQRFQQSPETRPMGAGRDLCGRRKDGSEFPVEIGLNPLQWDDQKAVLATVTDITERKQQEERQAILARELEHRVGNIFAVILATIRRTLTRGRNMAEAEEALTQRVQLLANAHAVLSESMFKNVSADKVIGVAVGGFKGQIASTGEDLRVNARAAQAISFIVHELLTNAVKHGALSSPSGSVAIHKEIRNAEGKETLVFSWEEKGAPRPQLSARKGFGSFILLETPKQFGGEAKMQFGESGLRYELLLPVEAIR